MALKVLSILLLLAGLVFAAPSFDDSEDVDDPLNDEELLDELDDSDNDNEQEDEDEDDSMEESPSAAKKSKKPKYTQLFGRGVYCSCKKGAFNLAPKKSDEFDMDEAADEMEQNAVKSLKHFKPKDAIKKALARMRKAITKYFKTLNLGCHCTKNKLVIRLLVYLRKQQLLGIRYKKLLARQALVYTRRFVARLLRYVRAIERQSKKPKTAS